MLGRSRVLLVITVASFIASTGFLFSPHGRPLYHATLNKLQPYTDAVTRPWIKTRVWPSTCSDRPYRVLTVGDSLTAGWSPPLIEGEQASIAPYSDQLSSVVRHALDVKNIGFTGYKADEIHQVLLDELAFQDSTDIFIIMSGTNDILGPAPDELYDPVPVLATLRETWTTALAHGNDTLVVVLNLMDIAFDPFMERVLQFNALLPEAVDSLNSSRVFLMDLQAQMTMFHESPEDVLKYWADPVHPTAEGYAKMGNLIGKQLNDLVSC